MLGRIRHSHHSLRGIKLAKRRSAPPRLLRCSHEGLQVLNERPVHHGQARVSISKVSSTRCSVVPECEPATSSGKVSNFVTCVSGLKTLEEARLSESSLSQGRCRKQPFVVQPLLDTQEPFKAANLRVIQNVDSVATRSEPGASSTFAGSPGSLWDNKRAAMEIGTAKKKSQALYHFFSFQEPCTGNQIDHFAGRRWRERRPLAAKPPHPRSAACCQPSLEHF